MTPITVTVRGMRDLLGVGNTKAYELINDGMVETIAIGRRRLVLVASIEKLVESLRAGAQR
jgi:hypothetical protein